MSAFERNPLKRHYETAAFQMSPRHRITGQITQRLSPQNRRVRFAVDTELARAKDFRNHETRQQRRRQSWGRG